MIVPIIVTVLRAPAGKTAGTLSLPGSRAWPHLIMKERHNMNTLSLRDSLRNHLVNYGEIVQISYQGKIFTGVLLERGYPANTFIIRSIGYGPDLTPRLLVDLYEYNIMDDLIRPILRDFQSDLFWKYVSNIFRRVVTGEKFSWNTLEIPREMELSPIQFVALAMISMGED